MSGLQATEQTLFRIILLSSSSILLLASCGGGSTTSQAPAPTAVSPVPPVSTTSAAVYLTDDFSSEYETVWVSVSRITAMQGTTETELAAFSPARVVNLPELKRAGLFVGTAAIPVGTTAFRVYVGADARIRGLDGIERTVQLTRTANSYIEFNGTSWTSSTGVLALDFDLPRFVLVGNVLTPATRLADSSDQGKWTNRHGELKGVVVALTPTLLTLELANASRVDIVLNANTTYRASGSATWTPAVGGRVEVELLLSGTAAQPVYVARSVHDESLFETAGSDSRPEIAGRIVSISGTTIVVDLFRSEDFALTGRTTFSIAGATYKRGAASLLQPGVRIEAHVARSGTALQLVSIEVEGAAKTESLPGSIRDASPGSGGTTTPGGNNGYAELKGSFVARQGNLIDVRLFKVERVPSFAVGTTVSVDTSGAYFEKGSLDCLITGSPVEVKGYLDGTGKLVVVKVELEGACGVGTSPAGSALLPGQLSEAKGLIQTVGNGQFTMQVFKSEYWASQPPASVTVTHDQATLFKDLSAASLRAGLLVEVKGTVTNSVLKAAKIEAD